MFISFFFAIRLFWTFLMWIRSGTSIECTADVGMFHHPDIISSRADHRHDSNTKQYKKYLLERIVKIENFDFKLRKFTWLIVEIVPHSSSNMPRSSFSATYFLSSLLFYLHKHRKDGENVEESGCVFGKNVKNEK